MALKITKQEWLNRFAQANHSLVNDEKEIVSYRRYLFVHNATQERKCLTAYDLWRYSKEAPRSAPQITPQTLDPLATENPLKSEVDELTAELDTSYEEQDILRSGVTERDQKLKERDQKVTELEQKLTELEQKLKEKPQPEPRQQLELSDAVAESLRIELELFRQAIEDLPTTEIETQQKELETQMLNEEIESLRNASVEELLNKLKESRIAANGFKRANIKTNGYRGEEGRKFRGMIAERDEEIKTWKDECMGRTN